MKLAAQILLVIFAALPMRLELSPLANYLREPGSAAKIAEAPAHQPMLLPIKTGAENIALGAEVSYAVDVDSGVVLHAVNAGSQQPIASITKLMTALVIIKSHSLDELITVPPLPGYQVGDEVMGLVPGQKFLVRDLLKAAIIQSANDAADALALADSGTKEAFAAKMNGLAKEWGISSSNFTNPSGLSDQDNYATAEGLAKLGELALTNPTLKSLVASPSGSIADANGRSYNLVTTNRLLGDRRFSGLKTGYTAAAGQSVMSLVAINGHPVITVVLNSPDRFGETTALANYLERNFKWQ